MCGRRQIKTKLIVNDDGRSAKAQRFRLSAIIIAPCLSSVQSDMSIEHDAESAGAENAEPYAQHGCLYSRRLAQYATT